MAPDLLTALSVAVLPHLIRLKVVSCASQECLMYTTYVRTTHGHPTEITDSRHHGITGIHSGFLRASLALPLLPNPADFEIWEAGMSQATVKGQESLRDLAILP